MERLRDIITDRQIKIFETATYNRVINELIASVTSSPLVSNAVKLKEAILEREKIITTGVGLGLAVPHARNSFVQGFTAAAVLIRQGIDWKAIDDQPVYFAVLVISPYESHQEYLQIMAEIVLTWKNQIKRESFKTSLTPLEIYRKINSL